MSICWVIVLAIAGMDLAEVVLGTVLIHNGRLYDSSWEFNQLDRNHRLEAKAHRLDIKP